MHRIRTPQELAARRVRRAQLRAMKLLQEEQSATPHSEKKRQELRDVMLRPTNEQKLVDERKKPASNGPETAEPKKRKLNRRERRERSKQRKALGLPEPQPTPSKPKALFSRVPKFGQIPLASEGWTDQYTADPQFRIAGIRVVIFDDGLAKKYYRMLLRNGEVKLLRELAHRKLKEARREIREAERKEAKLRKLQAKALVAMFGRS